MRVYVHLGFAYEWRKMFPEAITAIQKGVSLGGETLEGQADLARALIEGGERKEGLLILRRLESEEKRRSMLSAGGFGWHLTVLAINEKALDFVGECLWSSTMEGCCSSISITNFDPLRVSHVLHASCKRVGAASRPVTRKGAARTLPVPSSRRIAAG